MSTLVDPELIEGIVGTNRSVTQHIARADTQRREFFLLHSQTCVDEHPDLRTCEYSVALDKGVPLDPWQDWEDTPVIVRIAEDGTLKPEEES